MRTRAPLSPCHPLVLPGPGCGSGYSGHRWPRRMPHGVALPGSTEGTLLLLPMSPVPRAGTAPRAVKRGAWHPRFIG